MASFAFELTIERNLIAAAHAWINVIENRFCVGRGYPDLFEFATAIHRIAIREADVSDGGLPEVHRLGFVVVDC